MKEPAVSERRARDLGSHLSEESRFRVTFGILVTLLIVATIPVFRFITGIGVTVLPELVLLALLVSAALGYAHWDKLAVVLQVSAVLIVFACVLSGTETSINSTLRIGLPLALLVILVPAVLSFHLRVAPGLYLAILQVFLSVQALSAIAGLLQLFGINISQREFRGRASGLADHPNVLGLMCAVSILVCIGLILRRNGSLKLAWIYLFINFGALIGTGSLSSMLSLFAGLVVLLVSMRDHLSKVTPLVISAVFAVSVSYFAGFNVAKLFEPIFARVDVVTGNAEGVASLSIREATYDYALNSIPQHVLTGVGMDATNEGTFNGVTVVHNYLLRGFYQGGIFLFLAFSLITLYAGYLVVSALVRRVDAASGAVSVCVLAYGMTSALYDQQQYWLLLLGALTVQRFTLQSAVESEVWGSLPSPVKVAR